LTETDKKLSCNSVVVCIILQNKYNILFKYCYLVVEESWAGSVSDWGSNSGVTEDWGSNNWSVDLGDNWGNSLGNSDGWGRSVDNSVESIDIISGVGDGTDGTIGFNKGVLSTDNISVTGFGLLLLVSGQTIGDGVSIVVLWMRIVWFGSNSDGGLGNNWGSVEDWSGSQDWSSVGNSNWSWGSISEWSSNTGISWSSESWGSVGWSSDNSAVSDRDSGEENDGLDHLEWKKEINFFFTKRL